MRRGWRRFRLLPAPAQAAIGLVVAAAYTVAIVALVSGGGGDASSNSSKKQSLSSLEKGVRDSVTTAKLFQREQTDVTDFRRPNVTSISCDGTDCRVVYTVAVPGRGRIIFQQLEMVRSIFDHTAATAVTVRVERSLPAGPQASPKAAEETPRGFPLIETSCQRSRLPRKLNFDSQKEAQALLANSCKVRNFNQGALHGNSKGGSKGPTDDSAAGGDGGGGG